MLVTAARVVDMLVEKRHPCIVPIAHLRVDVRMQVQAAPPGVRRQHDPGLLGASAHPMSLRTLPRTCVRARPTFEFTRVRSAQPVARRCRLALARARLFHVLILEVPEEGANSAALG